MLTPKTASSAGAKTMSAPIRCAHFVPRIWLRWSPSGTTAFADRRNFLPMTPALYGRRVLECPAFDPAGLILAWQEIADSSAPPVELPATKTAKKRWWAWCMP